MTREETFRAFRAVADSANMDYANEFSSEAFRELMARLSAGLDKVFTVTKDVDKTKAERHQEIFRKRLGDRLDGLRKEGLVWDEKGVRDWIALMCPGFWPFC